MTDSRRDPQDEPIDVEISGPDAPGSLRGPDRDPPRPPSPDDPIDVSLMSPEAPGSLRGQDFRPPRGSQRPPGSPPQPDPIDVDMTGPDAPGSLRGPDLDPPRRKEPPPPPPGGGGNGGGGSSGGWRTAVPWVLGAVLLLALAVLLYREIVNGADADAGAVVVAHVADPRLDAPPPATGPSNSAVLVEALRTLRARPGLDVPAVLVLSGDLGLGAAPVPADTVQPEAGDEAGGDQRATGGQADTTTGATPGDTAAGAGPGAGTGGSAPGGTGGTGAGTGTTAGASAEAETRAAPAGAADSLGRALASAPVGEVYLVPSARPDSAALARVIALADSGGVSVYDLTQCYAPGAADDGCDADLAGTPYRLIGVPALPGDSTPLSAALARLGSLMDDAGRDRRRAVLVVAGFPGAAAPVMLDSLRMIAERGHVAAVLAGDPAGELPVPAGRAVRTPPLGSRAAAAAPSRGFSLVRLEDGRIEPTTVRYAAGTFRRVPRPPADAERGWLSRLYALGGGLAEPGRSAIFWLGVLTAFLTAAVLWKVPPRSGAAAQAPAEGAAPAQDGQAPAESDVLKSNLARTVASGLAGIAAVTVLKDVWNLSGAQGQAFFTVVFVIGFLAFLAVIALVRALIEAVRIRNTVDRPGWSFASVSSTAVVFLDTFMNVLLGHGDVAGKHWDDRFVQMQERLLTVADRVREDVSASVGAALRRAGVPDAREETDFRVSVSLRSVDRPEVFYLSAAREAARKVFSDRSVAYVAVQSREARWWKTTYTRGAAHRHLRSRGCLVLPYAPLGPATRLADLLLLDAGGAEKRLPAGAAAVAIDARRTNGERVDPAGTGWTLDDAPTLGALIRLLNGPGGMGSGLRPVTVSVDADGHLLVAETQPAAGGAAPTQDAQLEGQQRESGDGGAAGPFSIASLKVAGVELGPFDPVVMEEVVLLEHPREEHFPGQSGAMKLVDFYEPRGVEDYEGFIVIPVPWTRRGLYHGRRHGAIQISFRRAEQLDALWMRLERTAAGKVLPNFGDQHHVADEAMLPDLGLRTSLVQAMRVLPEVMQELNETWYRTRRRPR